MPDIFDVAVRSHHPMARGFASALNIAAPGEVVKAVAGRLVRISIVAEGSAAGAAHDAATVATAAAANKICTIPNSAGAVLDLDWPCGTGIVIVPGTDQVVAVSYV